MRRPTAVKIAALCLGFLVAGTAFSQAAPSLRSARNEHFEIVGLDVRSVNYVNELSLFATDISGRYLDRGGMAFPLPILVSLRPDEHANFPGDYQIRLATRGSVELDIRWEDSMTLERSCRALAEALLTQYALFNHGPEAVGMLRFWTVDALAREIYISLRPGGLVILLDRTRGREASPISALLEATASSPEAADRYGYWLLETMQSAGLARSEVGRLFRQAIAGIDAEGALAAAVQPAEPTAEPLPLQTWWRGQLSAILAREYEVVETMEASRLWLSALARFNTPLTLDSGEVQLNLRSIRTHRDNTEVREWVRARYEILRLRMARVNPAYYNPARSLGVLFEALLREAPPHEYLHALTLYLSDWEDAKAMEQVVEEKLQQE